MFLRMKNKMKFKMINCVNRGRENCLTELLHFSSCFDYWNESLLCNYLVAKTIGNLLFSQNCHFLWAGHKCWLSLVTKSRSLCSRLKVLLFLRKEETVNCFRRVYVDCTADRSSCAEVSCIWRSHLLNIFCSTAHDLCILNMEMNVKSNIFDWFSSKST